MEKSFRYNSGKTKKIAHQTGIPTTKSGIERKIGKMILKSIFGNISVPLKSGPVKY